ncbi:AcrR Transcriptional regulator [Candidatus Nanopelagicaceae bacterium]
MSQAHHPTKNALIEATRELLETHARKDISSDQILTKSGISKGSLYHHFEDLEELLEAAMLLRYTEWVDASIEAITQVLRAVKSPDDVYNRLVLITEQTQDPKRRSDRIYRAEVIGAAASSARLAKKLGVEQQRLTDALADLVRETQEKGFFHKEIDPRVLAVFIQAYTFGKVVDDFSDSPINPENWNALINDFLKKTLLKYE